MHERQHWSSSTFTCSSLNSCIRTNSSQQYPHIVTSLFHWGLHIDQIWQKSGFLSFTIMIDMAWSPVSVTSYNSLKCSLTEFSTSLCWQICVYFTSCQCQSLQCHNLQAVCSFCTSRIHSHPQLLHVLLNSFTNPSWCSMHAVYWNNYNITQNNTCH